MVKNYDKPKVGMLVLVDSNGLMDNDLLQDVAIKILDATGKTSLRWRGDLKLVCKFEKNTQ